MNVSRPRIFTGEHVGELAFGDIDIHIRYRNAGALVDVAISQNSERSAGNDGSLSGVTAHSSKPREPAMCADEFQALWIMVALNVQSRNHRPITIAILVEPSCSQHLEKRLPDCISAHVARDPARQR